VRVEPLLGAGGDAGVLIGVALGRVAVLAELKYAANPPEAGRA